MSRTKRFNEQTQDWELIDSSPVPNISIEQTTGTSESHIMSQKAVTEELNKKQPKGDYVLKSEAQSDWNVTDPQSPAYVKNRIGYKEDRLEMITAVPLGSYGPFESRKNSATIYDSYFPNSLHLSHYPLNSKVIVTWDSIDYTCYIKYDENKGYRYIGNESFAQGYSGAVLEGEPFYYNDSRWSTSNQQNTHEIKVQIEVQAIHQIDSDLLASSLKNTAGLITEYSEGESLNWKGSSEVFNDYIGNIAMGGGHAEGFRTKARGKSHAEGVRTEAAGDGCHVEGIDTIAYSAVGYPAHAEGSKTVADGASTHAEGNETIAIGPAAHAEGAKTTASGKFSHSEGANTVASFSYTHAEGFKTQANASAAHSEGRETVASSPCQHVEGQFNVEDSANKYAHIVGNGSAQARSNAHTLDWQGNSWSQGDVLAGGTDMNDPNAISLKKTHNELANKQPKGDYALKSEIPSKLPNSNALTFTGTSTETYDGTKPVTVEIPNGISLPGAQVGDLARVKAIGPDGQPSEWEPVTMEELEGKWELIETVKSNGAVFKRTEEPDGTLYNFADMQIKITAENPEKKGIQVRINCEGTLASYNAFDVGPNNIYSMIKLLRDHGFYDGGMLYSGTGNDLSYGFIRKGGARLSGTVPAAKKITEIKTDGPVPEGVTFEIWAVRA